MTAGAFVPEDAAEVAENVLAALLGAGRAGGLGTVERVRETGLLPEHFYKSSDAVVYAAILAVTDRGEPPDPELVLRSFRNEATEAIR